MYLHLGNDVIVNHSDIIGVFDIENTSISKYTKEYLRSNQQGKKIINVTKDIPKSFVITFDKSKKEKVYLSLLAPATLKKRFKEME